MHFERKWQAAAAGATAAAGPAVASVAVPGAIQACTCRCVVAAAIVSTSGGSSRCSCSNRGCQPSSGFVTGVLLEQVHVGVFSAYAFQAPVETGMVTPVCSIILSSATTAACTPGWFKPCASLNRPASKVVCVRVKSDPSGGMAAH